MPRAQPSAAVARVDQLGVRHRVVHVDEERRALAEGAREVRELVGVAAQVDGRATGELPRPARVAVRRGGMASTISTRRGAPSSPEVTSSRSR